MQNKTIQLNIMVQPFIADVLRDNVANVSEYVRTLIVADALAKGWLSQERLLVELGLMKAAV